MLSRDEACKPYTHKKGNGSIGLSCQNIAIDYVAKNLIGTDINWNSHVYNLGVSLDGLHGVTVANVEPGPFANTGGLWNQRYFGRFRWC